MKKQDITHSYNGENRSQLLADLKAEYERRIKLDFDSHEDADELLDEMEESGTSPKEMVTYIIQRYDLVDYGAAIDHAYHQHLIDYKNYVEGRIEESEIPATFDDWKEMNNL